MISSINGKIILIEENYIVLETSNLGYKIFVGSLINELQKNKEIFLWTSHIIRETVSDLYGFKTINELKFFELLISISGIGPKVGLSIISVSSPQTLKRAVISGNTDELTKVSGIGKKNATKIILELKNKIDKIILEESEENSFDLEIYETLEALGFERSSIRNVLEDAQGETTSEKIKYALKALGK